MVFSLPGRANDYPSDGVAPLRPADGSLARMRDPSSCEMGMSIPVLSDDVMQMDGDGEERTLRRIPLRRPGRR
jgi:hypothetical protein